MCGVSSKLWFSRYPKPEAVSARLESTTPPKPRQHHVARQPPFLALSVLLLHVHIWLLDALNQMIFIESMYPLQIRV